MKMQKTQVAISGKNKIIAKLLKVMDLLIIGLKCAMLVILLVGYQQIANPEARKSDWHFVQPFIYYGILNLSRLFLSKAVPVLLIEALLNIVFIFTVSYIHGIYLSLTAISILIIYFKKKLTLVHP